jgi:hypothetical protein
MFFGIEITWLMVRSAIQSPNLAAITPVQNIATER